MATELENMSVEELQVALDSAKAKKAEKKRIEREERRARERAEFEDSVDTLRFNVCDEFVGSYGEWTAVNTGYNGGLELTFYEGTVAQSSMTYSADEVAKLKEIINHL